MEEIEVMKMKKKVVMGAIVVECVCVVLESILLGLNVIQIALL